MKTQFFPQTSSLQAAQGADTCHDVVNLRGKEIMSLINKDEKLHLKCLGGTVWITQPGDPDDYILHLNESLTITKKGLVLVQAMPDAVVCQ